MAPAGAPASRALRRVAARIRFSKKLPSSVSFVRSDTPAESGHAGSSFKRQIVNRESKLLRCNACGLKLLQLLEPVEDDLVLGKTAVGGIVTEHEEFAAVRREVVVVDRTAE